MISQMPARFETKTIDEINATRNRLIAALEAERCSNREQVMEWAIEATVALHIAEGGEVMVDCGTCRGTGFEHTTYRVQRGRNHKYVDSAVRCTTCDGSGKRHYMDAA